MIRAETPDRSKVVYELDGRDLLDLLGKHVLPMPPNPLPQGKYEFDLKYDAGILRLTCTLPK